MVVKTAEKRKEKESRIVETPGIAGGRPRINGHRIRVQDVAVWYEQMGMSPDDIATAYELTLGEIYTALAYYYDHIESIRRDIERDKKFVAEMKKRSPSLLQAKLKKIHA